MVAEGHVRHVFVHAWINSFEDFILPMLHILLNLPDLLLSNVFTDLNES